MTFKGSMRSLAAAARRADRAQKKAQREREKHRKAQEKMEEIAQAEVEVWEFENQIAAINDFHTRGSEPWNWKEIIDAAPPKKPENANILETDANRNLASYKPSTTDKLFKRSEKKVTALELALQEAIELDEKNYQDERAKYEISFKEWKTAREFGGQIIAGEMSAVLDALEKISPFSKSNSHWANISSRIGDDGLLDIELALDTEEIVPQDQKSQLKSGKLSVKAFPKGKYYEIYQRYVCSAILRAGREVFAFLPIGTVIVTAATKMLNPATGHKENSPILSVALVRETMDGINIEAVEPAIALQNFLHNMNFKKTQGFGKTGKVKLKT